MIALENKKRRIGQTPMQRGASMWLVSKERQPRTARVLSQQEAKGARTARKTNSGVRVREKC